MEYTIINIRFKDENFDFKKVSPLFIHKFLDSISRSWSWIHTKIGKNVLIFKEGDRSNVQTFLKIKSLNFDNKKFDVSFEENPCLNNIDGVIYCRQLLIMSDRYILQQLKSQNVVKINRWKKRNSDGIEYETGLFFLTFKEKYKPDYISINKLTLPVTSSFQNRKDSQCRHCFMMGHKINRCYKRFLTLCPKCNKNVRDHLTENCEIKCINCQANHLSSSNDCSFRRNVMAVQDIKIKLLHQHERIEIQSLEVEKMYQKLNEVNAKIRKYEKYCIIYGSR